MRFEPARAPWLLFVGVMAAASCSAPQASAPSSRAAQTGAPAAAGSQTAQAGTEAEPDPAATTPPPQTDDGLVVPTTPIIPDAGAPRPVDNDGFSVAKGDCNDFEELINPGAYDVPGNSIDEDCDGSDTPSASCDEDLEIDAADPLMAARAIELCKTATEADRRWGVISARWTTPDGKGTPGSDLLHGILPNLGASYAPRQGKSLLALSSGVARAPGQQDATRSCSDALPARSTGLPEGFDGQSSSCEVNDELSSVEDAVALEIELRVPSNVAAISFDSAFFTDEYPDYICSIFNDFFQVVVTPKRMGSGKEGNVVFDQDGNSVSVNNSLLRVCAPGEHGGKNFTCPLGESSLAGTGIDDCAGTALLPGGIFGDLDGSRESYGASTGWLNTQFAVQPAEVITMRFTIWDSGDSSLDSVSIIDHVRFHLRSEPPPPEKPMTTPINPS
jgi:hypothetical protein